jgi:hypothetical protein
VTRLKPWKINIFGEINPNVFRGEQQQVIEFSNKVIVMPKLHQTLIERSSNLRANDSLPCVELLPIVERTADPVNGKTQKFEPVESDLGIFYKKASCRPHSVDLGKAKLSIDKSNKYKSSNVFKGRKSISSSTFRMSAEKSKATLVNPSLESLKEKSKSITNNWILLNTEPMRGPSELLVNKLDDVTSISDFEVFNTANVSSKSRLESWESSSPHLRITKYNEKDPESMSEHPKYGTVVTKQIEENLPMISKNVGMESTSLMHVYTKKGSLYHKLKD